VQGTTGVTGLTGPQGVTGATGVTGVTGPQGNPPTEYLDDSEVFTIWMPDALPASPSSDDDEFSGDSLSGDWTEVDHGGKVVPAVEARGLRLDITSIPANWSWGGIAKSLPSGDFSIETKLALGAERGGSVNLAYAGLTLLEGTGASDNLYTIHFNADTANVEHYEWPAYNASGSARAATAYYGYTHVYVRIRRNGSSYYLEYSNDGYCFRLLSTTAPTFTPTHMGLMAMINGTVDGVALFRFFRYRDEDVGLTGHLLGRRVSMGLTLGSSSSSSSA
jgi:hypothetical protein